MDYRDYVESLAINKQDKVFLNSGPIHASIVMSRIFKYAGNSIDIYCGGFSGAVSNDEEYLKNLESFLQKGGQLRILVEEDNSQKGKAEIFKILAKYKDQSTIYKTAQKVTNLDTKQPVHFTVSDNNMVRMETGTNDYTAQVNFLDNTNGPHLKNLFDRIWVNPKNIEIRLAC